MKRRLLASIAVGAIVAGIIVAWDNSAHHAALAATAAKSGGHPTVASILTSGFIVLTVGVAVVVFTLATVRARRRRARAEREWQPGPARRRGRAGVGW